MSPPGRTEIGERTARSIALGLFVGSLALRPQVIGIGPVAGDVATSLGLDHAFVGLLITLPVLAMGVFAPMGSALAQRFGAHRVLGVALFVLSTAAIARAVSTGAGIFLVLTAVVGVATGAAGAPPSIIAKLGAGNKSGSVAAVASAGVVAGAVLSAAAVVPLSDALGGWRFALGSMGVIGLGCSVICVALLRRTPPGVREPSARRLASTWGPAWILAAAFGLQGLLYWGGGAWVAAAYVERGLAPASAGGLVALMNGSALAASVCVAAMSDRLAHPQREVLASAVGALVACMGFTLAPGYALIWPVVLGMSLGAIFPLLVMVAVRLSADHQAAGSLVSFMFLVGYLVAGLGPIGLGAMRDSVGNFQLTFPILSVVAAGLVVVATSLVRIPNTPFGSPGVAQVVLVTTDR